MEAFWRQLHMNSSTGKRHVQEREIFSIENRWFSCISNENRWFCMTSGGISVVSQYFSVFIRRKHEGAQRSVAELHSRCFSLWKSMIVHDSRRFWCNNGPLVASKIRFSGVGGMIWHLVYLGSESRKEASGRSGFRASLRASDASEAVGARSTMIHEWWKQAGRQVAWISRVPSSQPAYGHVLNLFQNGGIFSVPMACVHHLLSGVTCVSWSHCGMWPLWPRGSVILGW